MINNKIEVKDFRKISVSNQYWLWHLTPNTRNELLDIQPISEPPCEKTDYHTFKEIIQQVQIPVYETRISDALDFLVNLDDFFLKPISEGKDIGASVLGFNYGGFVWSTSHLCYCSEGIMEVIAKLNPELLLKFELD